MDGVFIRKYLTDRGFNNDDINYDPTSKSVTYKGANLVTPDGISADGKSYKSQNSLDQAITSYQNQNRNNQLNGALDSLSQGMMNQTSTPFKASVQAPTYQPFKYDANSDPSYQAALASAQAGANIASKNSQEELNSRGILNSTITSDRDSQIRQDANSNVANNILPQLMQQAYQQYNDNYNRDYQKYTDTANQEYNAYKDQYGQTQDKYSNLASLIPLISGVNQQGLDNQFRTDTRADQTKQDNFNAYLNSVGVTGNLGSGAKNDYSLLFGTNGAKTLAGKQYDDSKTQQTFENNLATRTANSQISNASADNIRANAAAARQAGDVNTARLFDVWANTGEAPAGLEAFGAPKGTKLKSSTTTSTGNFNLDDYKGYINNSFYEDQPVDPMRPSGEKKKVFNTAKAQRYIVSLNLPDDQTDQLFSIYQIPKPK